MTYINSEKRIVSIFTCFERFHENAAFYYTKLDFLSCGKV